MKKFSRDTFLRVAVFCTAIWCIFVHFDYLKMRAKGRLSRWFFVPEWKVLRDDKGGHELGSIEQYVPFLGLGLLDSRSNQWIDCTNLLKNIVAPRSLL